MYYSIFTIYRVILASSIFRKFRYSQKVAWNTGAIICFCMKFKCLIIENFVIEIWWLKFWRFFHCPKNSYLLKYRYFKSKVLFCLYFTQCSIYMKLVKISSTKWFQSLTSHTWENLVVWCWKSASRVGCRSHEMASQFLVSTAQ